MRRFLCCVLLAGADGAWVSPSASFPRTRTRGIFATDVAQHVEGLQAKLLRAALLSGRGAWARSTEQDEIVQLVAQLEASSAEPPSLQDGTWELILSDVEAFRASTFFLALGEAVEKNIKNGASDGALTVHSLATGGGEVKRVAHVIEGGGSRLHSLVELKSGSLPSLPLALTGTVISSAELFAPAADSTFILKLKNTTVQESAVRYGLPTEGGLQPGSDSNALKWIGDQFVPSGDIFRSVLERLQGADGSPNAAELRLSYCDGEFMVWRTPRLGGHFFVFVKGDPAAWPAMDELRAKQAAVTSESQASPIGSAFALGMLNPFFTRAAGLRK